MDASLRHTRTPRLLALLTLLLLIAVPAAAAAETCGESAHPSGKDRCVEEGQSATQGDAQADPDDNGNPPERSNGGADEPGGEGGVNPADQDGNNGCGNDQDFEDDNEGLCLQGASGPEPEIEPTKRPGKADDRDEAAIDGVPGVRPGAGDDGDLGVLDRVIERPEEPDGGTLPPVDDRRIEPAPPVETPDTPDTELPATGVNPTLAWVALALIGVGTLLIRRCGTLCTDEQSDRA